MKIQIVDKQDNVIGVKERAELDYNADIYRVAALWVSNDKGEVPLAQRAQNKDKDPGVWGPAVAGTVDDGEDYDSNIYKEAEEEIGLKGVVFEKSAKIFVPAPRMYFCQIYTCKLNLPANEFKPDPVEVAGVKWIDLEVLKNELNSHPEKYVPALGQIIEGLNV